MQNNFNTLLLFIVVLMASCVKSSDYVINDGLQPDDIITFTSIEPINPFADSNTEILIRVRINSQSSANQSVTLTTTEGVINGSTKSESVTTNTDRYADFKLKVGQVAGPVFLKATVLTDYSRDTVLNFLKAYPDSIIIKPEKFIMEKNTSLPITIDLFRLKGYPSAGQNIFYDAADANGERAGTVVADSGFSPGTIINAAFTPNTDFTGDIFIIVTVLKEEGTKVSNSIKINIQ